MIHILPLETRKYYSEILPYITEQPLRRRDILASLLAANAKDFAAESEMDILAEKNFKKESKDVCVKFLILCNPLL